MMTAPVAGFKLPSTIPMICEFFGSLLAPKSTQSAGWLLIKMAATDTVPLPRVRDVERGGKITVHSIPPGVSPSSYYMLTRADRPPLDNVKVRQAINFAIDRKALLEVTFGKGTLKSNAIPPKHWAFNPESVSFNERDVNRAKSCSTSMVAPWAGTT